MIGKLRKGTRKIDLKKNKEKGKAKNSVGDFNSGKGGGEIPQGKSRQVSSN